MDGRAYTKCKENLASPEASLKKKKCEDLTAERKENGELHAKIMKLELENTKLKATFAEAKKIVQKIEAGYNDMLTLDDTAPAVAELELENTKLKELREENDSDAEEESDMSTLGDTDPAEPTDSTDEDDMCRQVRDAGYRCLHELPAGDSQSRVARNPWMPEKVDVVLEVMMTKPKLQDLFKCMAIQCSLTTNYERVFASHLQLHEVRGKGDGEKRWRQCAYCKLRMPAATLPGHITKQHGASKYQCPRCFYRAYHKFLINFHQEVHHEDVQPEVLECFPFVDRPPMLKIVKPSPYECNICGSEFYSPEQFQVHLASVHQIHTEFTCKHCDWKTYQTFATFIRHWRLHGLYPFECGYCIFGADTCADVTKHHADRHPDYPPKISQRSRPVGEVESEGHFHIKIIRPLRESDRCMSERAPNQFTPSILRPHQSDAEEENDISTLDDTAPAEPTDCADEDDGAEGGSES